MIRSSIESWRMMLVNFLISALKDKINSLPNDKYTIDFVKESLEQSVAWKNIENETKNALTFLAWTVQVLYFNIIESAVKRNLPLNSDDFPTPTDLPEEDRLLVEDAFDEIFKYFEKRTDDEGYESDGQNNATDKINDLFIETTDECQNWKDVITIVFTKFLTKYVDSLFIEPTISIILNFITSLRDENLPPSEVEMKFNQEDKSLKQALIEYKSNNEIKRKAQFLVTELYSIIQNTIDLGDLNKNKSILKTIIKYGYPIPLSTVETVATAFNKFLFESGIYKSGIFLQVRDDKDRLLVEVKIGEAKGKIMMCQSSKFVFLCRADYFAYAGITNQMSETVDNAFFYEAFVGFMKNQSKFPKGAETLREGLLKYL